MFSAAITHNIHHADQSTKYAERSHMYTDWPCAKKHFMFVSTTKDSRCIYATRKEAKNKVYLQNAGNAKMSFHLQDNKKWLKCLSVYLIFRMKMMNLWNVLLCCWCSPPSIFNLSLVSLSRLEALHIPCTDHFSLQTRHILAQEIFWGDIAQTYIMYQVSKIHQLHFQIFIQIHSCSWIRTN